MTDPKTTKADDQAEFIEEAIKWLECYPSTQAHTEGPYLEDDDVTYAEWIAALLSAELRLMRSKR